MANLSAFGGAQPLYPGGTVELGYAEKTSNTTITSTSPTSPTATGLSVTVVSDGSPMTVEFYCGEATPPNVNNGVMLAALWVDGAEYDRTMGVLYNYSDGVNSGRTIYAKKRITLAAGSHTIDIRGWLANNAGLSGYYFAGTNVSGFSPAYIRVSKIVQATQWPAVTTGTIICTSSTRPASPFEGQTIYETDNSRQLVWDGSAWVSPSVTYRPPMCKLTRGSNQTIANNTVTVVAYDTAAIDTDSMATTGASAKITANTAGVYAVGYTVLWGSTSTVGYRQAWVTISGSGRYAGSTIYPLNSGTGAWFITGSDIVELSAGQYVDLRVVQASGGNETIGPFAGTPTAFYAYWLGQP